VRVGSYTVAVIGGGQLARMMSQQATALGVRLRALVEAPDGATAQVVPDSLVGAAKDEAAIREICRGADVLTVEHEHVDGGQLSRVMAAGTPVRPGPHALRYAQDKIAMRLRLTELGIECPRWARVRTAAELAAFGEEVGWPVVVKTPRGGYDGKGVRFVHSPDDAGDWLADLERGVVTVDGLGGEGGHELLVEERVTFTRELAVMVARRPGGYHAEIRAWPVVETVQAGGICSEVIAPAPGLPEAVVRHAQDMAATVARGLDVTGVLAVELFCVEDDAGVRLSVNELAMRPHNTGHWTIEGVVTSQFEQHLRAVLDLPLGDTAPRQPCAVMVNLLGSTLHDPRDAYRSMMAEFPDVKVHLYGKEVRPGRKLGHVTALGEDPVALRARANAAVAHLRGDNREGGAG